MNKFLENILETWNEFKPFWKAMQECPQSPCWHSEGNVAIHTEMVLDEFLKIAESNEHDLSDKDILLISYSLLLHDIAKPVVLTEEDGLIRAHNHTRIGAKIAWELLEATGFSFEDRKEISSLIYWHGKPPYVIEKSTAKQHRMIIEMSMDCSMKRLYYVALCDQLGRICADRNHQIETIEYFKMAVHELDCFYHPFEFVSPVAKFNYLVKKTHHFTDEPFDDTRSKVYLMCGLPGSGKSIMSRKIAHDNASSVLPIIELDEIRKELKIKPTDEQGKVIQLAKKVAKQYLAKNKDFIWDATNITKLIRQSLINIFMDYNAYIIIVYMNTDFKTCMINNKSRDENKQVPDNVMIKMQRKLEIPFQTEAHEVKYK